MSRSYKHTPITKSGYGMSKQHANKKVRQRLKDIYYDVGNNSDYKSIVNSWNIVDYKCYCPMDTKAYRK
jgi:hypothetical protein